MTNNQSGPDTTADSHPDPMADSPEMPPRADPVGSSRGDERPSSRFTEPPRRPILGVVLLVVYLSLFSIVAIGFYRIQYVLGLVQQSEPLDDTERRLTMLIESSRYALFHGPTEQRIDILRQIGSPMLPAGAFLEDLRRLLDDENPLIAAEANATINRLVGLKQERSESPNPNQ